MFHSRRINIMGIGEIIRSVFEFALIVLTLVAVINEPKIAAFEKKFARACKIHLRNRRLRKQAAAVKAASVIQSRAPEDFEEEVTEPHLTLIECVHKVA